MFLAAQLSLSLPNKFFSLSFSFFDTGSPCSSSCPGTHLWTSRPGWPWTHRDLPASASWELGLKVCTTMPFPKMFLGSRQSWMSHDFKVLYQACLALCLYRVLTLKIKEHSTPVNNFQKKRKKKKNIAHNTLILQGIYLKPKEARWPKQGKQEL